MVSIYAVSIPRNRTVCVNKDSYSHSYQQMVAATFAHGEEQQRATGNGPSMILTSGQALIYAVDEGTT